MRKTTITILFLLASLTASLGQELTPYADVRRMVDEGISHIDSDIFIEGYCTVMGRWGNVAQNLNTYHTTVYTGRNNRTAYIQNEDASYGFCIKGGDKTLFSKLKMGDRLTINLKGTDVSKTESGMYIIRKVGQENVLRQYAAGADAVMVKSKKLCELTEADLCTFVTLKDCEFVFKDGAYINIYETYAQYSSINGKASPNGSMDGWASLLCDKEGNTIYTVCNTAAAWRRNGQGVSSGNGTISGTLLADPFPRYSAFPLGYQIRCMDETYYNLTAPSSYKTIAEWTWNNLKAEFSTTSGQKKSLDNAGVLPDEGNGILFCEVNGNVTRGRDFNNTRVEKGDEYSSRGERGIVKNGAMKITAPACKWWNWEKNEGNGIVAEFSTEGLSGERLVFGFTFAGGDIDPNTTVFFPTYWKVQYSIDGNAFKDVDGKEICCRSLPWYWGRPIKEQQYYLSYECGLGMTDHMVVLPKECFDHGKVSVRIVPSRRNASTYSVTSSDKAAITKGLTKTTIVTFGSVVVRYN